MMRAPHIVDDDDAGSVTEYESESVVGPDYRPSSPGYRPTSPDYRPTSPDHRPTSPDEQSSSDNVAECYICSKDVPHDMLVASSCCHRLGCKDKLLCHTCRAQVLRRPGAKCPMCKGEWGRPWYTRNEFYSYGRLELMDATSKFLNTIKTLSQTECFSDVAPAFEEIFSMWTRHSDSTSEVYLNEPEQLFPFGSRDDQDFWFQSLATAGLYYRNWDTFFAVARKIKPHSGPTPAILDMVLSNYYFGHPDTPGILRAYCDAYNRPQSEGILLDELHVPVSLMDLDITTRRTLLQFRNWEDIVCRDIEHTSTSMTSVATWFSELDTACKTHFARSSPVLRALCSQIRPNASVSNLVALRKISDELQEIRPECFNPAFSRAILCMPAEHLSDTLQRLATAGYFADMCASSIRWITDLADRKGAVLPKEVMYAFDGNLVKRMLETDASAQLFNRTVDTAMNKYRDDAWIQGLAVVKRARETDNKTEPRRTKIA